jgi:hypothetical protein
VVQGLWTASLLVAVVAVEAFKVGAVALVVIYI